MNIFFKKTTNLQTHTNGDTIILQYKHLYIENTSINPASTLSVRFQNRVIIELLPNEFFDFKDIVSNDSIDGQLHYEEKIVITADTLNATDYKLYSYGKL